MTKFEKSIGRDKDKYRDKIQRANKGKKKYYKVEARLKEGIELVFPWEKEWTREGKYVTLRDAEKALEVFLFKRGNEYEFRITDC